MAQRIWITLRQARWPIIIAVAALLLAVPVSLAATNQQPAGVSQGIAGGGSAVTFITLPPAVGVAVVSDAPSQATAVDYFLKIEGVDGESTDQTHDKWIAIDSFQWGGSASSTTTGAAAGGGRGKVSIGDLNVVTQISKASPKLFLAMAKGDRIAKATLAVRKAGARTQGDYLTFTFTDVLITSYQVAPDGEKFSLNFSKIEFEYRTTKADGSLDAPVKTGWDLKANKSS